MAIKSSRSRCNFKISDFSHSTRGCLVSGLLPGRGRCSAAECCCRTPRSGQLQPCSAADTSPDIRGAGGGQTRHQWTCYHRLRLRRPQTAKRRSFQRQVRASSWPHNNEFTNQTRTQHSKSFKNAPEKLDTYSIISSLQHFIIGYFLFNRPIPFDTSKWFKKRKNQTRFLPQQRPRWCSTARPEDLGGMEEDGSSQTTGYLHYRE